MLGRRSRRAILVVLAFEAVSALPSGLALVVFPDGRALGMPVAMLPGVFPDFLVPGLLLSALGALNAWAFLALRERSPTAWLPVGFATGGMVVWIGVEMVILQAAHWAHAVWGLPAAVAGLLALPLVPRGRRRAQLPLRST